VVNRIIDYFRPIPPAPEMVADPGDLRAIGGAILYWESIRDRAFKTGHHALGRLAAGLADGHRTAWARLQAEADWCCSNCGSPIAQPRD
jgi:hypothetical protein